MEAPGPEGGQAFSQPFRHTAPTSPSLLLQPSAPQPGEPSPPLQTPGAPGRAGSHSPAPILEQFLLITPPRTLGNHSVLLAFNHFYPILRVSLMESDLYLLINILD